MPSAKKRRANNKKYYERNKSKILPNEKQRYRENSGEKRAASLAASKASYDANPKKKRAASKASYDANPKKKRAASKASYDANPKKKRAASRASYDKNPKAKNKSSEAYYEDNKESLCANRRGRYALAEPKPDVKDMYLKAIQANLLGNSEARVQLIKAFKKQHESLVKQTHRVVGKTVCRLGANRLLNKALQMRKEQAGSLLKTTRSIQSLQMRVSEDFGEGCHTAATEPYYYDSAYQLVKRPYAIPIDKRGRCIVAQTDCAYKTWHCSSACKPVSEAEIDAIVALINPCKRYDMP